KEGLIQGIEQTQPFNEVEVNRTKNLVRNHGDKIINSAGATGSCLRDYELAYSGNLSQYFKDLDSIQKLSVNDVNRAYQVFFKPEDRIFGNILPTPEDQKKAQQLAQSEAPQKSLAPSAEAEEPLKDVRVYQAEVKDY